MKEIWFFNIVIYYAKSLLIKFSRFFFVLIENNFIYLLSNNLKTIL